MHEDGAEGGGGQTNGIIHSGGANGFTEGGENKQPNQERFTTPFMTKYEKARILGTRALQIRSVGSCINRPSADVVAFFFR